MPKIVRLSILVTLLWLNACSHGTKNGYDAIVDPDNGAGTFPTLQAALNAAPADANQTYRILVKAGRYYEKVTIDRNNVEIQGEGTNKTAIEFDAYAGGASHYRDDNWGTPGSATLSINATDIHIADLAINNTFDFLANDARSSDDPGYLSGSQAVALLLDKDSDRISFHSVMLNGYQDTLFANGYRAYFYQSTTSGNVDFIFGQGTVVFDESTIISRPRTKTFNEGAIQGYITAPSTNIQREYGLTFLDCELQREDGVPDNSTTLGRPWHPTTTFEDGRYADPNAIGKAVFIRTYMDGHISPKGWSSMGGTPREGTEKRIFTPEESRFYEYQSTGPGAHVNNQRPQLSDAEAARYTLTNIFGDWSVEHLRQ